MPDESDEGFFSARDGLRLFWHTARPAGTPSAHVAVLHGYAEHLGRHEEVTRALASAGPSWPAAQLTSTRRAMMGSGDRSQRIRTYNFPQNRCTDHRLGGEGGGEKNFNLEQIVEGHMDPLIDALLELDKQQRLESL